MRLKTKALIGIMFLSVGILYATSTQEGNVVEKTAQAIDFTQTINVSDLDNISMQAVYSDGTPGGHPISGGARSAGTIRVESFESLIAKKAQVQITVSSYGITALDNAIITINGAQFREGDHWAIAASSIATARNISDVINAHFGLQSTHTLSNVAIITASASVAGSAGNAYAITSSTAALTLSAATLSGGQDNATIHFPTLGVILTQGTDFFAMTSTAVTALNISTAINANATLASLVIATRTTGVNNIATFWTSSTINGYLNYPISVSTPTALVVSGHGLSGGATAEISTTTDRFSKTNHLLTTGLAVLFSTAAGSTAPGGLTNQTTYFAIVVDTHTYKLATSTTNAFAGTAIDLSSLPQALAISSYTITPCPLTLLAGNGFFWQASNDGTNFSSLSVSSVTYSAAGNTLWDFGRFSYKYLRTVFTAPTRGGIRLTIRQFGKKD